jgi:hypothetical protein
MTAPDRVGAKCSRISCRRHLKYASLFNRLKRCSSPRHGAVSHELRRNSLSTHGKCKAFPRGRGLAFLRIAETDVVQRFLRAAPTLSGRSTAWIWENIRKLLILAKARIQRDKYGQENALDYDGCSKWVREPLNNAPLRHLAEIHDRDCAVHPAHWCASTPVHRPVDVPVRRCTGPLTYRSTGPPVCRFIG